MAQKERVYTEIVDSETFELELLPETTQCGHRLYVVRRGGEPRLEVKGMGTSLYAIVEPSNRRGPYLGYCQHNRRGALIAAALLLTRGLPPPKPKYGEDGIRRLADSPPGKYRDCLPQLGTAASPAHVR